MYLYGALLVEGMYATGLVVYENGLTIFAIVLLICSKLAFYTGARLVGNASVRRREFSASVIHLDETDRVFLFFLIGGSILAGAFAFSEAISVGVFSGGYFGGGGLADARGEMWSEIYSDKATASPMKSMMTVASFCLAILLPFFYRGRRFFLLFISLYSCLVVVAEALLSAGRFSLALLILCLIVSFSVALQKTRLTEVVSWRVVLVVGGMIFYSLIVFPVQRNPELPYAVAAYLSWLADAEIASWVYEIAEIPGLSWFPVLAYSSSYFSGSLDKLSFFVSYTEVGDWYTLGLYNLPIISQIGSALGFTDYYWVEIRQSIAGTMNYVGLAGNPWATGLRDFVIDFGSFGAVVVIALVGMALQACYVRSLNSMSIYWKILGVVASVAAFIMSFVSPLQIRLIANTFVALLLFILVRWVVTLATRRKSVGMISNW